MVMILVYRGRSENQVTAVTLAIQKYAIIAYTTRTPRGRREVGARKPPANKRIYKKAPVSKLHMCNISDWVQNTITETVDQAAYLHCDRKRRSYPSSSSPIRRRNL